MSTQCVQIVIICDIGEEIDDEAAIVYHARTKNLLPSGSEIHIVATGVLKNMSSFEMTQDDRISKLETILLEDDFKKFLSPVGVDEWVKVPLTKEQKACRLILEQTGPVTSMDLAEKIVKKLVKFDWVLLGMLDSSLNAKAEALEPAIYLGNHANRVAIIDNTSSIIPKFTFKNAQNFGPKLADEILAVAFKNTFGRANPVGGMVHLVGVACGEGDRRDGGTLCLQPGKKGKNGASYDSVGALYHSFTGRHIDDINVSQAARKSTETYFDELEKDMKANTVSASSRNHLLTVRGQSENSQKEGLARITQALFETFGVPLERVLLSDKIELREFDNKTIQEVFKQYKMFMGREENESTELTPAYAFISAVWTVGNIRGILPFPKGKFSDQFLESKSADGKVIPLPGRFNISTFKMNGLVSDSTSFVYKILPAKPTTDEIAGISTTYLVMFTLGGGAIAGILYYGLVVA